MSEKTIRYKEYQTKLSKQGTYRTAPSGAEILERANKCTTKVFDKYYPGVPYGELSTLNGEKVDKLINDAFKDIKVNPKRKISDQGLLSINDYFFDHKIEDLVVYMGTKGFTKTQTGQVLLAHLMRKIDATSEFAEKNNIVLSDVDDFSEMKPHEKFGVILNEYHKYGYDTVADYYENSKEILMLNKANILELRPTYLKKFKKHKEIQEKVDRDIARQFFGVQSKEYNYPLKRALEYQFAFDLGLKYLKYCYSSGTRPINQGVAAEFIAKAVNDIRNNMPGMVSSHINAYTFWGTQLGRNLSDQDLKDLNISRKQFQSIISHVFDELLRFSEASAFSLTRRSTEMTGYKGQPERVLVNTVKALLESQNSVLKQNADVNLMVVVNDTGVLKFRLPVNASDDEIKEALNDNASTIRLSPTDRYNLKLDAYKNPKNRSPRFKEIYGFKGTKSGYGDYIIRLTTKNGREQKVTNKSVFSMFTVGNYQALIDVNMDVPEGLEYSIKAAHREFDAVALSSFYDQIYQTLKSRHLELDLYDRPKIIEQSKNLEIGPENMTVPLPEAMSTSIVNDSYETVTLTLGKNTQKISPAVLRALDLAWANKVPYIHLLYKSDNNPYSNPKWDNIQPVIISLDPIKEILAKYEFNYRAYKKNGGQLPKIDPVDKKKLMEYAKMVNEAIIWARRGFGTPAVLAAPFGGWRKMASDATTSIYENVKLLNQSYGMLSATVGNDVFDTAQSTAYRHKVDLSKAKNHLGVIGSQATRVAVPKGSPSKESKAIYTVKKNPNQSQAYFREKLVQNSDLKLNTEQRANVIKVLNKVVDNWEKLIFSDKEYRINNFIVGFFYEDYDSVLRDAFKELKKDSFLGKGNLNSLGIHDHHDLQVKLNKLLLEDAKNTVDPERISSTHDLMTDFFKEFNSHSGKTGPLPQAS
jgi:hypothetical protein